MEKRNELFLKLRNQDKGEKIYKNNLIKKKTDKAKEKIGKFKSFFLSIDIIHFLFFKLKNSSELNKLTRHNSNIAVESLIRGLGGEKNLLNIKNTTYSICITFKSDYLLNRDFLLKSGGVDIRIVDKSFFSLFDKKETKLIAKKIKQRINDARRKYKPLEID